MVTTIKGFNAKYTSDDVCLYEIFTNRYGEKPKCPSCKEETKFHKVTGRKCYSCQFCGYQLHPLAGTIFHKSDTSLKLWFYAIFLFSVSKNGVSAMELQRQLGVTYKCAWRMAKQIRLLFKQFNNEPLDGTVEVDETYMGGRQRGHGRGVTDKTAVVGMVERKGRIIAQVVENTKAKTVNPIVRKNVKIFSQLITDESSVYKNLDIQYFHRTVNHSAKQYVNGIVHTNTIEGFWSQLKRSINGTYHAVSPKHLQSYVDEFSYRYSNRYAPSLFSPMISQAAKPA